MTADIPPRPGATPDLRARLLEAAVAHVPFDGWSGAALAAAARDLGVEPGLAWAAFPRGGLDLVLAFHRRGDAAMVARLGGADLTSLRMRDRVARAVMLRLEEAGGRDLVRRAAALLALPQNAPEGARAIWGTADAIWTALGEGNGGGAAPGAGGGRLSAASRRASLAAVYAATVLYWLGDDSPGAMATRDFLERRIADMMRFGRLRAALCDVPPLRRRGTAGERPAGPMAS